MNDEAHDFIQFMIIRMSFFLVLILLVIMRNDVNKIEKRINKIENQVINEVVVDEQ